MLDPKTFQCEKGCRECCEKLTVKVDEEDIKQIQSIGKKDFYEFDKTLNANILRKKNLQCIFLKKDNDDFNCTIYENRPKICRQYPFFEDNVKSCKPVSFLNPQ